jgi:hypothetical protein
MQYRFTGILFRYVTSADVRSDVELDVYRRLWHCLRAARDVPASLAAMLTFIVTFVQEIPSCMRAGLIWYTQVCVATNACCS